MKVFFFALYLCSFFPLLSPFLFIFSQFLLFFPSILPLLLFIVPFSFLLYTLPFLFFFLPPLYIVCLSFYFPLYPSFISSKHSYVFPSSLLSSLIFILSPFYPCSLMLSLFSFLFILFNWSETNKKIIFQK